MRKHANIYKGLCPLSVGNRYMPGASFLFISHIINIFLISFQHHYQQSLSYVFELLSLLNEVILQICTGNILWYLDYPAKILLTNCGSFCLVITEVSWLLFMTCLGNADPAVEVISIAIATPAVNWLAGKLVAWRGRHGFYSRCYIVIVAQTFDLIQCKYHDCT